MTLRFGNKVRETSSTTGTGPYSLAGASSGYAGFVAATGDGAVVVYRAQMGDDWEIGLGTVTDAAPDTLARTEVLETLVAGTYDNTSPSAVNWGAGTKTIDLVGPAQMVDADSGWYLPHPRLTAADRYIQPYIASNTNAVVAANELYLVPFYFPARGSIKLAIFVQTGAASTNAKLAVYSFDPAWASLALLEGSTDAATTAQGLITFTTTEKFNPGWYVSAAHFSGAPTMRKTTDGNSYAHIWGVPNNFLYNQGVVVSSAYASGLPDPVTPAFVGTQPVQIGVSAA